MIPPAKSQGRIDCSPCGFGKFVESIFGSAWHLPPGYWSVCYVILLRIELQIPCQNISGDTLLLLVATTFKNSLEQCKKCSKLDPFSLGGHWRSCHPKLSHSSHRDLYLQIQCKFAVGACKNDIHIFSHLFQQRYRLLLWIRDKTRMIPNIPTRASDYVLGRIKWVIHTVNGFIRRQLV